MVAADELLRAFVAALPAGATASEPAALGAALLDALLDAVGRGRAAWPEVALAEDVFAAHLGKHFDPCAIDGWRSHAPDLWLACACAVGNERGVASFEARFRPLIDGLLRRMRLDGAALDDARQMVHHHLLVAIGDEPPRVATYSGRGELAGWVRSAATRVTLNLLRGQPKGTSSDELLARVPAATDDPELALLKARYAPSFRRAFGEALAALDARTRLVLKQHYVDGLSTDELGKLHGVHRVTVLRWLTTARQDLARDAERRLSEGLRVAPRELASLMRLVRSRIELNFNELISAHD